MIKKFKEFSVKGKVILNGCVFFNGRKKKKCSFVGPKKTKQKKKKKKKKKKKVRP